MRSADWSSVSGSSDTVAAFSLPPPHDGRTSSRSERAMHRSRMGEPRDQSAMCSTRSRNVGSPQWMSSNTSTSGRSRAEASKNRRIAQNVSSPAADSATPISCDTCRQTSSWCSSPSSTEQTFDSTTSGRSKSARPAACLIASTTGKYVMPSP